MIDVQVLVDKLNGLESADEVAAFLQEQGVIGVPMAAEFCPVSNWIRRESGEKHVSTANSVRIWETENTAFWNSYGPGDIKAQYILSPFVQKFIVKFDSLNYPNLVRSIVSEYICEANLEGLTWSK